jgi:hypothetical protein
LRAEAVFREFWKWLGFDYAAIDIDGSLGSTPLDLNYYPAPNESLGKYQLVTNLARSSTLPISSTPSRSSTIWRHAAAL